ncbi:MAG TPA: T9SS type A sorting domain-containing protein, partial [Paludibacter sp.]|nr:T9SS type A sorting domain-containing protein [Paludibacter sp.]
KSGNVLADKGLWLNPPYTAEFPWLKQAVYSSGRDLGPYELQEGQINTGLQVIMNRDAKLNLSVSPNPCVNEMIVKFSTDNPSRATVDICNLNGQIVSEVYEGQADSGVEYYIPASVSSLSNGVYLCRLVVGNTIKTSKMIVTR